MLLRYSIMPWKLKCFLDHFIKKNLKPQRCCKTTWQYCNNNNNIFFRNLTWRFQKYFKIKKSPSKKYIKKKLYLHHGSVEKWKTCASEQGPNFCNVDLSNFEPWAFELLSGVFPQLQICTCILILLYTPKMGHSLSLQSFSKSILSGLWGGFQSSLLIWPMLCLNILEFLLDYSL